MLTGKRLLITGVATPDSIASAVVARARDGGAEVVATAFPRDMSAARDVLDGIDPDIPVVPVDATSSADLASLAHIIKDRWGTLDGILHAIAYAPRSVLMSVMEADPDGIAIAMQSSVWTFSALARLLAGMAPPDGASLVGLDFDSERAWPVYNWMGPCKAALRSLSQYLARDLGPQRIRSNLVAAGPLRTRAASGIPDFDLLLEAWRRQAPLAWDSSDAGPVADTVCFLLSDLSRAITGEVIHADGGFHAIATSLRDAGQS
ncbi:MAG: SDR family oxidoreductase [Actinobacteria bacterium]|jgi:enoyl-[acyl-carrier protein] reductase I|nr:SDR family oxidoreductase [Actinomycetota bacterium]